MISGDIIGSDCEATGLFWRHGDRPYCFSFCNLKGETAVISFRVNPYTRQVMYEPEKIAQLKAYYGDPTKTFVFHNAAYDVGMLKSVGIEIKGKIICTLIIVRLVRSAEKAALKDFCSKNLGIPIDDETTLQEVTRKKRILGRKLGWKIYEKKKKSEKETLAPDYWLAGPKYYEPYCVRDAARCLAVYDALYPDIVSQKLEGVFKTEIKTWHVLRKIEERGIRIDKAKVINNKIILKKKFQTYQTKARTLVNNPLLNLNSPKQLSPLFYQHFKEPVLYYTKAGFPSTENAALKVMKNELASHVLNARACTKTMEFMAQYLRYMVKHEDGGHYIHASFHEAEAVTGRESCSDPNLQQVAKGRNSELEVRVEGRSVFIPRPGYNMDSFDWKNIEVFIPAFESKDKKLVKMLLAGEDVHDYTSRNLTKICGMPVDREQAKRTFFGLQYGIQAKKLSKTLGITLDLAERIIMGFGETYPGLVEWMDDLIKVIRRDGYIRTRYNRLIYVPRDEAYKGVNYFVQGTAGGILKSAKIKVHEGFVRQGIDAHIVLPVHDELLNEYHKSLSVDKMRKFVVRCMQDNPELNMPIPIPVSISAIGSSWAEKIKIAA